MGTYLYKCPDCSEAVIVQHTIAECEDSRLCPYCPQSELRRQILPVALVGPRTKPGSKEVKTQMEHEQQRTIDRKRKK